MAKELTNTTHTERVHITETATLPMIPVRGMVIFPQMSVHFDIGRDKSVAALNKAVDGDSLIFLVSQKNPQTVNPLPAQIFKIGTVARVKQVLKLPGENVRVLVQGLYRAKTEKYLSKDPYYEVLVAPFIPVEADELTAEAYKRHALSLFESFSKLDVKIAPETLSMLSREKDINNFIDIMSAAAVHKDTDKQQLLSEIDTLKRLTHLCAVLADEIEILKIEKKISGKVKMAIDKSQKEYYLREQIKAIHDELGEGDEEVAGYFERIKKLKLHKESQDKVLKEVARLSKMAVSSPESAIIRNYADWVLDLPWKKETKDNRDLNLARQILNEDHYGLDKAKQRILEFLAVHTLTRELKGPILCFVGPPGVGKTSIARSIARALNRNYVRMSLGGVRDEAEIRGHRKTYIGAMPGRILYSMKTAGTINPVFLLDEIDKMSSDFRGDPASAMLEVLDPEQNNTFRDHFLEIPYDLSKVMFITTANSLDTIPAPLLDRMEVITLSGYTDDEKLEIAKRYLIPKQAKSNGINIQNLSISDSVLFSIINNYTREAGVRSLEREIANVCRRVAKSYVESGVSDIAAQRTVIDETLLREYLGTRRYTGDEMSEVDEVGAATGLAWTSVGGTALTIEVQVMNGKGEIVLTGHLGDVMKESARTALSFIKAHSAKYGLDPDMFSKSDIHIHVPEGAVPKDGPSAGITIATAIFSALTNRAVARDIAMTGEITLRGRVLAIGGLKEKTLAAHRMGIKSVIIPKDNQKDIDELPEKIKNELNLILVENIGQVLQNSIRS